MKNGHLGLRISVLLTLCFAVLGPVKSSWAAVIFETNFDSDPEWNAIGQYEGNECSPRGHSSSANICIAETYPTNWEGYRTVPCYSHSEPQASIRRPPGNLADHTGSGIGKSYIVYNESYPACGAPWPGDSILVKFFGENTYSDLYTQFWMRTQPGWQWKTSGQDCGNSSGTTKFFRTGYWAGLDSSSQNIFQMGDISPMMLMDLESVSSADGISHAYRCDPSANRYCENTANAYEHVDYPYPIGGAVYSDGNWHRMKFHFRLNTIGSYDGITDMWIDGQLVYSHHDVVLLEVGSTITGFNTVMFGGNSCNQWSVQGVQWYAIDDIVVSTSDIVDDYIPGGAGSDVTVPDSPRGLTIQ
jgi:hypothetical protein